MKSNYKLLKKYPSLSHNWEVGMIVGQGDRSGTYANFSPCDEKYNNAYIPYEEVYNNPEFWGKVVEKDYEILAFRLKNPNYPDLIRWKNSFGLFPSGEKGDINNRFNEFSEESLLKPENKYEIYSIKRKSDGVIFTIGDKIILDNWMQGREYIQIDEIYYNEHNQLSFRTNMSPAPKTFVFGLSDINYKIYKEPLFTTEDGVELFLGDKYWYPSDGIIHQATIVDRNYPKVDNFYWSSKKKANAYVKENKPKYSKKDVLDYGNYFFVKGAFRTTEATIEELFDEYTEFKKLKK